MDIHSYTFIYLFFIYFLISMGSLKKLKPLLGHSTVRIV